MTRAAILSALARACTAMQRQLVESPGAKPYNSVLLARLQEQLGPHLVRELAGGGPSGEAGATADLRPSPPPPPPGRVLREHQMPRRVLRVGGRAQQKT